MSARPALDLPDGPSRALRLGSSGHHPRTTAAAAPFKFSTAAYVSAVIAAVSGTLALFLQYGLPVWMVWTVAGGAAVFAVALAAADVIDAGRKRGRR